MVIKWILTEIINNINIQHVFVFHDHSQILIRKFCLRKVLLIIVCV